MDNTMEKNTRMSLRTSRNPSVRLRESMEMSGSGLRPKKEKVTTKGGSTKRKVLEHDLLDIPGQDQNRVDDQEMFKKPMNVERGRDIVKKRKSKECTSMSLDRSGPNEVSSSTNRSLSTFSHATTGYSSLDRFGSTSMWPFTSLEAYAPSNNLSLSTTSHSISGYQPFDPSGNTSIWSSNLFEDRARSYPSLLSQSSLSGTFPKSSSQFSLSGIHDQTIDEVRAFWRKRKFITSIKHLNGEDKDNAISEWVRKDMKKYPEGYTCLYASNADQLESIEQSDISNRVSSPVRSVSVASRSSRASSIATVTSSAMSDSSRAYRLGVATRQRYFEKTISHLDEDARIEAIIEWGINDLSRFPMPELPSGTPSVVDFLSDGELSCHSRVESRAQSISSSRRSARSNSTTSLNSNITDSAIQMSSQTYKVRAKWRKKAFLKTIKHLSGNERQVAITNWELQDPIKHPYNDPGSTTGDQIEVVIANRVLEDRIVHPSPNDNVNLQMNNDSGSEMSSQTYKIRAKWRMKAFTKTIKHLQGDQRQAAIDKWSMEDLIKHPPPNDNVNVQNNSDSASKTPLQQHQDRAYNDPGSTTGDQNEVVIVNRASEDRIIYSSPTDNVNLQTNSDSRSKTPLQKHQDRAKWRRQAFMKTIKHLQGDQRQAAIDKWSMEDLIKHPLNSDSGSKTPLQQHQYKAKNRKKRFMNTIKHLEGDQRQAAITKWTTEDLINFPLPDATPILEEISPQDFNGKKKSKDKSNNPKVPSAYKVKMDRRRKEVEDFRVARNKLHDDNLAEYELRKAAQSSSNSQELPSLNQSSPGSVNQRRINDEIDDFLARRQGHISKTERLRANKNYLRRGINIDNSSNDENDPEPDILQDDVQDFNDHQDGEICMTVPTPGSILNNDDAAIFESSHLDRVLRERETLPKNRRRNMDIPLSKKRNSIIPPQMRNMSNIKNAIPPLFELPERQICPHCRALTHTLNCCMDGDTKIPPPLAHPNYLKKLLVGTSPADVHMRKEIVKYNNSFALGSMSYNRELGSLGHSVVKVNGMVHHQLAGSVPPLGKHVPLFHQIYKYDINEATEYRMMNPIVGGTIQPNIARNIQSLLEEKNYLIKQYKTSIEVLADMIAVDKPIKNLFVVLRSPTDVGYKGQIHPGTLSRPKQELQSVLYTSGEDGAPPKQGLYVVRRVHGGGLEVLGYWNPLIDPISYPLLFPYGNSGYRSREFKKGEDYVMGQRFDDDFDEFPYELLGDEMDKDVEPIKYIRARNKYKKMLMDEGEDVSDFEPDEDECKAAAMSGSQVIADVEDNDFDEVNSEYGLEKVVDVDLPSDPLSQVQDSSENQHALPASQEEVPDLGDDLFDIQDLLDNCIEHTNDDDELDVVDTEDLPILNEKEIEDQLMFHFECNEQDEESQEVADEHDPNLGTSINDKIDWKHHEEQAKKEIFEEELRVHLHNQKIRNFKVFCLKARVKYGSAFIERLFPDPVERRRLHIDLDFLERKRMKHIDHLYFLADVLLDMTPYRVTCCYPNDDDEMSQLQADIDYELGWLVADPTYKFGKPKIDQFRKDYLMPSTDNDHIEAEEEDIGDLVQHGVGPDWSNELTEQRKKMKSKGKARRDPVKAQPGPRVYVSRRQHALHQMQVREKEYHPYLSCLLLGQLYIIDLALRIVRQRHDNSRDHMIKLRGSHEHTLTFQMHSRAAERKGFKLGYAFQISDSLPGSVSWYKKQFENAMAMLDYTGKPDLFITMTGNPRWKEITDNLLPNSDWSSNPFLVNDVFHLKMQELLNDVIHRELFGPVLSYCYSIEFQKRGMPHMHLLLTLKPGHKLDTSAKIDNCILATIPEIPSDDDPDKEDKERFRKTVCDHMLHTSCIQNPNAYCRAGCKPGMARCNKMFPVPLNTFTSTVDGGKVDYHRPVDEANRVIKMIKNKQEYVDNRYVVPYSPWLLNRYDCHINVEAVTTVDVVKYIYKYIYKGFDKALAQFIETFEVDNGTAAGSAPRTVIHASKKTGTGVSAPQGLSGSSKQWNDMNNRIAQEMSKQGLTANEGEKLTAYDEAIMVEVFRQMTASEAAWIIQAYPLACQSHTVINLSVHEEGKMPVWFRPGEEDLMQTKIDIGSYQSQLLAWFALNKRDTNAHQYTFDEIPLHYIFEKTPKYREWRPMLTDSVVKRVVRVRAVSPRFLETFATRLLCLNKRGPKSFADLRTVGGIVYKSAHEAAKALGLMDNQIEFENCLNEAKTLEVPNKLRRLFATMLIYCGIQDPLGLWEMFEEEFYDRRFSRNTQVARAAALHHIEYLLEQNNSSLEEFNLPGYDKRLLSQEDMDYSIDDVISTKIVDNEAEAERLESSLNEEQLNHMNTILNAVDSNGRGNEGNCFFLQGSGGCGKTYLYRAIYHRLQTRGIRMQTNSKPALELLDTTVFIIDEATMASSHMYEAINRLLQDITNVYNRPFGGKIMLLGGDWKQLLPVVPGHSSFEAISYSLKHSFLWKYFKVLTLSKNMRAQEDPKYAKFLENIGNGLVNGRSNNDVFIDQKCLGTTPEDIVQFIYDDLTQSPATIANSCILASLNSETNDINKKVLDMLPGPTKTYRAIDTPKECMGMQLIPEYFRDEMPSGMPPFDLTLKVGAIVILLRNLCVSDGLCNGSRLMVKRMHNTFIEVELLTTDHRGNVYWISPISVDVAGSPNNKAKFKRFQYPFRLAYALTINKSQGQTFDRVGIILNNNVFAHGQLYVALSRARTAEKVRIFSAASKNVNGRSVVVVKNRVEQTVLEEIDTNTLYDPEYELPDLIDAPLPSIDGYVAGPKRIASLQQDLGVSRVQLRMENKKKKAYKKKEGTNNSTSV